MNDLGHVSFFGASYVPGGAAGSARTGVWYVEVGNLRQLARQGTAAPGTDGLYFKDNFHPPALSRNGRLAFGAAMEDPAHFPRFGDALFVGTADDFRVVAYPGGPAPDAVAGTTINSVMGFHYDVSDRGDVIFDANTSDGSRAMYVGTPGALRAHARAGNRAPGLPQGVVIDTFGKPAMNEEGDYTFVAKTAAGGVTGEALYAGSVDGGPRLVAASGRRAPGVEGEVFFRDFVEPEVNDAGQVAFTGLLGGPEAREVDYGLFATDPNGQLHLIARTGDLFEIAPGDLRTIRSVTPGLSGVVSFEGDELVFTLRFTDGLDGIFTARVVPEPSVLGILAAAAALALRRRRD